MGACVYVCVNLKVVAVVRLAQEEFGDYSQY